MSFGQWIVEEALGVADLPVTQLRRVCSLVLVGMMFVFPITFRHGVAAYVERETRTLVKIIDKALPHFPTAPKPNAVRSDKRHSLPKVAP